MGNETSDLSSLEINGKAVEVTDYWSQYSATLDPENATQLTVFKGEPVLDGNFWISQTPLERASKNLMIYRHPGILRYISSWKKGSTYYLAVEHVKPLSRVLAAQTTLQVCVGLYNTLKALVFLQEKALVSHNNICISSVYVTGDGSWKISGLEYLCKLKELSLEYLSKTRNHRYDKGIDPNEGNYSNFLQTGAIDQYAYSVFALEVLRGRNDDDIPLLRDFCAYCKTELQNQDVEKRPKLSSVLDHQFFKHDFITIHCFLSELPLKTNSEKMDFFSTLCTKLRTFPELTIASQLGSLLLSRMVLLDETAQKELLPFVLCPRDEASHRDRGIFSEETFQQYLVPQLLRIFCVRDAQIRLLLLKYFKFFMQSFTREQLELNVLPELLVGIKDSNAVLVAETLRSLADLVHTLGPDVVIGGKRLKLFTDGCLLLHSEATSRSNTQSTPVSDPSSSRSSQITILPERPSPDGGEDDESSEVLARQVEEDLENWSDWDAQESENTENHETQNYEGVDVPLFTERKISASKVKLPDILELDIKSQPNAVEEKNEIDFFQDMEPVIVKTSKFIIDDTRVKKFDVTETENVEECWGDDLEWTEAK